MYDGKGGLWIDFTKRFKIDSDSYLTSVINYIHQNPVKHGFVRESQDWKFSSYQAMISTQPTLLKREQVISWFGKREDFILFHNESKVDLVEQWE